MYCGSATFENSDEDPTGCFELWPSEEIAALLACTRDAKIFDGKNVCELAAGASGLFGLVLAAANPTVKRIHLTDGSLVPSYSLFKFLISKSVIQLWLTN